MTAEDNNVPDGDDKDDAVYVEEVSLANQHNGKDTEQSSGTEKGGNDDDDNEDSSERDE